MAIVNISYAGTNLTFCDGTPAENGNGWYGPLTVNISDDDIGIFFDVDVTLVHGTLMITAVGYNTVVTNITGCEDFGNYPDIPEYEPEWYKPPIWNTWPPYDPSMDDPLSFKWCECEIYKGVVEYGECMTKPVDRTDSCCNHVPLDFKQWMINFEYYDGEE